MVDEKERQDERDRRDKRIEELKKTISGFDVKDRYNEGELKVIEELRQQMKQRTQDRDEQIGELTAPARVRTPDEDKKLAKLKREKRDEQIEELEEQVRKIPMGKKIYTDEEVKAKDQLRKLKEEKTQDEKREARAERKALINELEGKAELTAEQMKQLKGLKRDDRIDELEEKVGKIPTQVSKTEEQIKDVDELRRLKDEKAKEAKAEKDIKNVKAKAQGLGMALTESSVEGTLLASMSGAGQKGKEAPGKEPPPAPKAGMGRK